jgi:hypothetical protein
MLPSSGTFPAYLQAEAMRNRAADKAIQQGGSDTFRSNGNERFGGFGEVSERTVCAHYWIRLQKPAVGWLFVHVCYFQRDGLYLRLHSFVVHACTGFEPLV